MTAVATANRVKPVGPVEGSRLAYLMEGKPPGGGPSCTTGMSLTDCTTMLTQGFCSHSLPIKTQERPSTLEARFHCMYR